MSYSCFLPQYVDVEKQERLVRFSVFVIVEIPVSNAIVVLAKVSPCP